MYVELLISSVFYDLYAYRVMMSYLIIIGI